MKIVHTVYMFLRALKLVNKPLQLGMQFAKETLNVLLEGDDKVK